MVHGAGYDRIGDADLAVFNSESLRDLAAWPGRSIVCHPPTFPEHHRVPSTGDAVTIVNCSKAKGIKTAWRCAEALPEHRRSEEHTSELQSRENLVCRLLLEKKK